jgi:hypothetical protein
MSNTIGRSSEALASSLPDDSIPEPASPVLQNPILAKVYHRALLMHIKLSNDLRCLDENNRSSKGP